MLNLYVWSQKLNILIVLALSTPKILAKPVLKYNEDCCVFFISITYVDFLGISQYYKTIGPRRTSLISPSNS